MNNSFETVNRNHPVQKIAVLFFLPAILFVIGAWIFGTRAADLFQFPMLAAAHPLPLIILFIVCLGLTVFRRWLPARLQQEAPGILLAVLFFLGYLLLASIFNQPNVNANNVFFATDIGSWQGRLVSDDLWAYGLRAVHPFAFLILRPVVMLFSILTAGDKFFAGLITISFAGAGCVYATWKLLEKYSSEGYYRIGFASLLGLSAAHLLFGSIFESYIFSALFLILFSLFTLNEARPLWMLIPISVLTFGMTISNFGQNVITLFFARKNLRILSLLYVIVSVVILAVIMNIVNDQIYATNIYFFNSGDVSTESKNIQLPTSDHLLLLTQDMFVFNIAAPQPHYHGEQLKLRFNFATDGFDYFTPLGRLAALGWLCLMGMAAWQFIKSFDVREQRTRFSIAMLACLGFNYLLHIVYGNEPFLYTPDWTYALVLFVAFNIHFLAEKIWFKIGFLVFLGFLLLNNGWFIYFMISLVKKNFGVVF